MRNVKTILAAAVLGFASVSQGAIVVSTQLAAVQPPQGSAGTLSNHTAFILNISSTDQPLTSINLKDGPGFGINGPSHQRWTWNADDEVFVSSPRSTVKGDNSTSNVNLDSHILIPAGNEVLPPGGAPAEDNNSGGQSSLADVAESVDYGYGSFIRYNAGLIGSSQSTSVDVAYLVIRNDQQLNVVGDATVLGGTSTVPFSFTVAVPEPASAGLLAVAAVGMLGRRRRA